MIEIVPFHVEHLDLLEIQDAQRDIVHRLQRNVPYYLSGEAYTVMKDGKPKICGGGIPTTRGWYLWAILSKDAKGSPMVAATKALFRAFSVYRDKTFTAAAEVGFEQGCRWLDMLGFKKEQRADVGGKEYFIYVREAQ